MFSQVLTAATYGIGAYLVEVETHIEGGLFHFEVVGLPDNAIRESRERVLPAIKNSGFKFPYSRITVNLAPADIRKEGSAYDLPIAVSIVAATGEVDTSLLRHIVLLGELSLDGTLRPIHSVLPMTVEMRRRKIEVALLPEEDAREAAMVDGVQVYPMASLREVIRFLNGENKSRSALKANLQEIFAQQQKYSVDFSDVKGQDAAKRALEVAAAGGHNIIMVGPPGSGKTMLAKRLPTILPPMTFDESLETTKIHSVADMMAPNTGLVATRPFRSPHHTISDAALVGGGTIARPGEISLANHGVLFLDELPEFARNVLEVLRQRLEDGRVTVSRAKMSVDFPANLTLVSAMNPCLCGWYGDSTHECSCTPTQIQKYMAKISGPLLDRIDIHIEVPAVKYKELSDKSTGEPSVRIRDRVVKARRIQTERFNGRKGLYKNADMQSKEIREFCHVDAAGEELIKMAITKLGLSARAYDRILKVSRTIADLSESQTVRPEHMSEAIQYRSLDRNLWS
jgi:magnesium chelatase family protein